MLFITILLCLITQWFFAIPLSRQFPWVAYYLTGMRKQFLSLTHDHRLFSFLLLVLPVVITVSLIFTLTYHAFGRLGYFILSLMLLWYCIDITDLISNKNALSDHALFLKSYQKIFSLLFWYFIFGPIGLTFYVVISAFYAHLSDQKYFILAQGVLDWLPVRLMGLSFALAGNFNIVFKEWMRILFEGTADAQRHVVIFGELALSHESSALNLIRRALIIWLVVMGLVALGSWID